MVDILYKEGCYVALYRLIGSIISKYILLYSRFRKQSLANSKSKMAGLFQDGGYFIQRGMVRGTVSPYWFENKQVQSSLVQV